MNTIEKAIETVIVQSDSKYTVPVLTLFSVYFIYRAGKSVGEFIYYVTH